MLLSTECKTLLCDFVDYVIRFNLSKLKSFKWVLSWLESTMKYSFILDGISVDMGKYRESKVLLIYHAHDSWPWSDAHYPGLPRYLIMVFVWMAPRKIFHTRKPFVRNNLTLAFAWSKKPGQALPSQNTPLSSLVSITPISSIALHKCSGLSTKVSQHNLQTL